MSGIIRNSLDAGAGLGGVLGHGKLRYRGDDDPTDYEHRHFVNLLAAAFLIAIAVAMVWTVKAVEDYEKLVACISAGHVNCMEFSVPPSIRERVLVR
jgi:hypothetical protein